MGGAIRLFFFFFFLLCVPFFSLRNFLTCSFMCIFALANIYVPLMKILKNAHQFPFFTS